MGEKPQPGPESESEKSVSERIAAAADRSRREREARGVFDKPRRSVAWDDLGGQAPHPFDSQASTRETDPDDHEGGIPVVPDPRGSQGTVDKDTTITEEQREAARRGLAKARRALVEGSGDDPGEPPTAPDPRQR